MNDPTPVRGEDAQFPITKRRSDFFAKNVRLRAQVIERIFNPLHWLSQILHTQAQIVLHGDISARAVVYELLHCGQISQRPLGNRHEGSP